MTTKFNQEMYAKMRAKKNEPLSNLRKRVVCVIEKGTLDTPATFVPETMMTTSPATSVEEITPRPRSNTWRIRAKRRPTHAHQVFGTMPA